MAPKVLLVEFGWSHNEILFTQTEALRARGVPFALFLNARLRSRLHPAVAGDAPVEWVPCTSPAEQLRAAWRARRRVVGEGFTHVVVNTASGNAVRLLSVLLPASTRAVGIVHDARKIERSGSQAFITRRFRDYLVLADHLVPARPRGGPRVGAFYPIAFPAAVGEGPAPAASPFRIVIPGNVSYGRRDYRGLLALWRSLPADERGAIQLEILGNIEADDGPAFEAHLRRDGAEGAFVLHRGFVAEDAFYARLAGAHAVLPLLHPGAEGFEGYRASKISGAFNLAYGFRKPLLMHSDFRTIPDFARTAVFYELPRLPPLGELREACARIAAAYARDEALRPERQMARYAEFVLGGG